jgi:oxygen-dependent protoporphyrinogen oxidase
MKESVRPLVVVVGAGITGLVAARRIGKRAPDVQVILLELDERLGGKVLTQDIAGVPVEAGADWFVTRNPAALELCRELGLEPDLVRPSRSGAYVWSQGALRLLPPGLVRGIPTRPVAAVRAGVLSPSGAIKAMRDLIAPGPLTGGDVSIGSLVRRRFGDEVLERLVDPLLAASRSGSADEMSLAAAAPDIDAAARSSRSVMRALRRGTKPAKEPPPFLGLRRGMSSLIDALIADMDEVDVRTGVHVESLHRIEGNHVVRTTAGDIEADAVIAAVPASVAADLLRDVDTELCEDLRRIRYAPAVVATLVYPSGAGTPPAEGSGMLVPSTEGRLLTACAWFSEKWAHAKPEDGGLILRCFVGRGEALELPDDELVAAIAVELRKALALGGPPVDSIVTRWPVALPVYRVGHLDLIDRIERRLTRHDGIVVAGAGYRGSGLPDCIGQGERAADHTIDRLDRRFA